MALEEKGYMEIAELKAAGLYPSEERMRSGPVAVVECIQEIPCNPCENACKRGAINIGSPITNLPEVKPDVCNGCGLCVAQCPGLAIFLVDKSYSETVGMVAFPYEYNPIPEQGQKVKAVDRSGKAICDATVVKVQNPKSFDRTPVVTIEMPIEYVEQARGIQRRPETASGTAAYKAEEDDFPDDMLVCRCEEVTLGEIREAIRQGATDVTGIKRRTRAGMGLCQGRTCEKLVQQILRQELQETPELIGSGTARPPVRPVTFGALGGGEA